MKSEAEIIKREFGNSRSAKAKSKIPREKRGLRVDGAGAHQTPLLDLPPNFVISRSMGKIIMEKGGRE